MTEELDESAIERLTRIGGPGLIGKMIDLCLAHATKTINAAELAQREGNAKAIASAMHSLKSSAGNIGAHGLKHLAESIERHALLDDRDWVATELADLKLAYERVASLLIQRKEAIQG